MVLLNQFLMHLEVLNLSSMIDGKSSQEFMALSEILTPDQKQKIQRVAYRYDQIELRDNLRYYKLNFGVDIADQVVKTIKALQFSEEGGKTIEIHRYNPLFNGYHLLMNLTVHSKEGASQ